MNPGFWAEPRAQPARVKVRPPPREGRAPASLFWALSPKGLFFSLVTALFFLVGSGSRLLVAGDAGMV